MPSGVNGKSIGVTVVGGIFMYSGIKGLTISTTIRDLISGKNPSLDVPNSGSNFLPGTDIPSTLLDPSNPKTFPSGQSAAPSGKGRLATRDIYKYALGAGFNPIAAVIITAIALAESGGNPMAHNAKPPDDSYGLTQINMIGNLGPARRAQWGLSSNDQLFDPATNMRAAYSLSHGTFFQPWTTFTSGAYAKYLGAAQQASKG